MNKIIYNAQINVAGMTRVDALMDRTIFEYKTRVNDLRLLQVTILQLAKFLFELKDNTAVLIIDETKISKSRLSNEWRSLGNLIQPSVFSRMRMVVFASRSLTEKFGELSDKEMEASFEIQGNLSENPVTKRNPKKDAFYEILWILLVFKFRNYGPLQINRLCQISGFSYPSVATALQKLEDKLVRSSDRSVELKSFPESAWFKFLSNSDEKRSAYRFWAYRPRPVEDLMDRLAERTENDFALGGIVGTRHYFPGIDLIGVHRLDISVVNWSFNKIEALIYKLDPGLKKTDAGTVPQIVVHNLARPESLFVTGGRFNIADEVECLLDLHEARLDMPFMELLEHFKAKLNQ